MSETNDANWAIDVFTKARIGVEAISHDPQISLLYPAPHTCHEHVNPQVLPDGWANITVVAAIRCVLFCYPAVF